MSIFDLIRTYLAVKADCKRRYELDVRSRMQELIDAFRMEV